MTLWIGTYPAGGAAGSGEGIWQVEFDAASGELTGPRLVVETTAPSFLALHPDGHTLYAVAEVEEGAVTAFRVSRAGLSRLDARPTGGTQPCHLLARSDGLYVANYGSGDLTTLALAADGTFAGDPEVHGHTGSGPVAERQEGPHAHYAGVVGDDVWVCDLGTDELRRYRPRPGGGEAAGIAARLPAGAGPRHFVPVGAAVVVTAELDGGLYVLAAESGVVLDRYEVTGRPGDGGRAQPSHLALSPDGSRLFVAVRGVDTLATFAVTRGPDGMPRLEHLADTPLGRLPRHFAVLAPPAGTDADLVVVADQESSSVTALRMDRESGRGTPVSSVGLPAPACVLPAR